MTTHSSHTPVPEPASALLIRPASRLGEVEEYYFSRKLREIAALRQQGIDVLNLGIGSPDLPPDAGVIETLAEAAQRPTSHAYQGYTGLPELRRAFAHWYQQYFAVGLDPDTQILPLMGSKEGIMHIAMTYLEAGDEALVPNPGYPAYRAVSQLAGATVREYTLAEDQSWFPDLEALARQDLRRVKLMWVNYPNMPTGAMATPDFFARLVAFARQHHILLVNDNPYAFILNDRPLSLLQVPGAMDVALELNSLSKSHNMAGWRMGMVAGRADLISDILRFKSNMDSGMFKPLQLAAIQALQQPPEWYSRLNSIYRSRRRLVFELLDRLGCTYNPAQVGMFVWARIPSRYATGYELSDEVLAKAGVFITPGGIFGGQGERYVRISLCSDEALFAIALQRVADM